MSDFITNAEPRIEAERLCDENDVLKAENACLLYDNAHLQEIVTDDELYMRKVLDENAKLREFMSDILTYGYGGGFLCSDGVWSCPHFQKCFNCPVEEGPEQYVRRGCKWLALVRELGVEVPNA